MRRLSVIFMLSLLFACANTPAHDLPSYWIDDAEKNRRARELVDYIRQRYGSDAFLTVSQLGPQQYAFKDVVERFGRRAAIIYNERYPDFIIVFYVDIERGIGPWRDIEVQATLIRSVSERDGSEPILISEDTGSCSVDPKNKLRPCDGHVERLAESTLYSFIHP